MDPDKATREMPDAEGRRRAPSRSLAVFLAASLAAHAGVLVILPGLERQSAPARSAVLEVIVMKPEPLPAAAPEPEPATASAAAKPESRPVPATRDAVLALAKPKPDIAGSFSVAPARLPEPESPAARSSATAAAPDVVAVTPPSLDAAYLNNPSPRYPDASRRAGEQGTVLLRVLIKRDGLPLRVELEKTSGSAHLDAAARDAVWGWRFVPARQGTDPIESWYVVPVVFRLEGAG